MKDRDDKTGWQHTPGQIAKYRSENNVTIKGFGYVVRRQRAMTYNCDLRVGNIHPLWRPCPSFSKS